ncbi:MAG: acyl-CoA thioester hydrolase/BAAT C-terminal domain-containing protein [Vicinamibacterales bacterium]
MNRYKRSIGAASITLFVVVLTAWSPLSEAAQSNVTILPISQDGIVGRLFLSPGAGRQPAVIIIGGSEGGLEWSAPWGVPLVESGFIALALAYFGTNPLPARLQSIPLEYFTTAIEFLRQHPRVDAERLGLMGFSKGAEAALLIAASSPAIRAVVAASPSHVAWPGITGDPRVEAPSWTLNGAAVPFVPYDVRGGVTTPFDGYSRSLGNVEGVSAAEIPAERINGPVLLISGADDRMWPASLMADRVMERLRRNGFRFSYTHLRLDDAGHAVLVSPAASGVPPARLGGSPDANRRARGESSRAAIEFLEASLTDSKGTTKAR